MAAKRVFFDTLDRLRGKPELTFLFFENGIGNLRGRVGLKAMIEARGALPWVRRSIDVPLSEFRRVVGVREDQSEGAIVLGGGLLWNS
jgi:hypothetical protein